MKTRTTRETLFSDESAPVFELCLDRDLQLNEFVRVYCDASHGECIEIAPNQWPFLRDAIDRMFEEIAENESEGKLKKLLETPAPWDEASEDDEEQALPEWDNGEWEPYDPYSNVLAAVEEQAEPAETSEASGDSGWIPWNGGECPVLGIRRVLVRFCDGYATELAYHARIYRWHHAERDDDIIAYKVVD